MNEDEKAIEKIIKSYKSKSFRFQPIFRITKEELEKKENYPFSFSEFIRKNVLQ